MKTLELKKFVAKVKRFNKGNNTLPILDNFLIEAGKITANNLEVQFTWSPDGLSEKTTALVSISFLEKIAKKTKSKFIDLDLPGVITTGKATFNYDPQLEETENFPQFDLAGSKRIGTFNEINVKELKEAVFFAGNDDLRPVMSGVNIDKFNIAATDAHVLYFSAHGQTFDEKFIIPKQVIGLMTPGNYTVNYLDFNNMSISNLSESIYFRPIEGKYPNYDAVIPKENPSTLHVEKPVLMESLDFAQIASSQVTHQVILNLSKDSQVLSSGDSDFKTGYSGPIDNAGFTGPDLKIGFNAMFLQKAAKFLPESLSIAMSLPNRAAILNSKILVMPVMLDR